MTLTMTTAQDKIWLKLWKENSPELRDRVITWRKQDAVTRIEKPSRILRARRLGYKAKQGIIVVRMRVGTGGMRRKRPTGCLLYTSPSPRDKRQSRMPSSA